jgi:hypothetical protein
MLQYPEKCPDCNSKEIRNATNPMVDDELLFRCVDCDRLIKESEVRELKVQENLKKYRKVIGFIKGLDDEGIETYIQVGKELGHITGDEESFRQTLLNIRNSED